MTKNKKKNGLDTDSSLVEDSIVEDKEDIQSSDENENLETLSYEELFDKNEDLEKKFLIEANEKGILGLNGHRSEGGIRISLYNSITDEMVDYLSEFMDKFFADNEK